MAILSPVVFTDPADQALYNNADLVRFRTTVTGDLSLLADIQTLDQQIQQLETATVPVADQALMTQELLQRVVALEIREARTINGTGLFISKSSNFTSAGPILGGAAIGTAPVFDEGDPRTILAQYLNTTSFDPAYGYQPLDVYNAYVALIQGVYATGAKFASEPAPAVAVFAIPAITIAGTTYTEIATSSDLSTNPPTLRQSLLAAGSAHNSVLDGGTLGSAGVSASTAPQTPGPTVVAGSTVPGGATNAVLAGNYAYLTFSEPLLSANKADPSCYKLVDSSGQTVSTATGTYPEGNSLMVYFPPADFNATTALANNLFLVYLDPTAGNDTQALQGLGGNDSASFTQALTNLTLESPSIAPSVTLRIAPNTPFSGTTPQAYCPYMLANVPTNSLSSTLTTYQWFKNGVPIPDDPNNIWARSATGGYWPPYYSQNPTSWFGAYQCLVTTPAGTALSDAITLSGFPGTLNGQSAVLCRVSTAPNPSYPASTTPNPALTLLPPPSPPSASTTAALLSADTTTLILPFNEALINNPTRMWAFIASLKLRIRPDTSQYIPNLQNIQPVDVPLTDFYPNATATIVGGSIQVNLGAPMANFPTGMFRSFPINPGSSTVTSLEISPFDATQILSTTVPDPDLYYVSQNAVGTQASWGVPASYTPTGTAPVASASSSTVSTDGTQIALKFDSALNLTTAYGSTFSVRLNGTATALVQASVDPADPTRLLLTMSPPILAGQTVTVSYTAPAPQPGNPRLIASAAGFPAASFGPLSLSNTSTFVASLTLNPVKATSIGNNAFQTAVITGSPTITLQVDSAIPPNLLGVTLNTTPPQSSSTPLNLPMDTGGAMDPAAGSPEQLANFRFTVNGVDYLVGVTAATLQTPAKVYVTSLATSNAVGVTNVANLTAPNYLLYFNQARIKILSGILGYHQNQVQQIQQNIKDANAAMADVVKRQGEANTVSTTTGTAKETMLLSLFSATHSVAGKPLVSGADVTSAEMDLTEWKTAQTKIQNYIDQQSSAAQQATLDYQQTLNRYNGAFEAMSKLQDKLDNVQKSVMNNFR